MLICTYSLGFAVLWCRQKSELEGSSEATANGLAINLSLCVGLSVRCRFSTSTWYSVSALDRSVLFTY